MDEPLLKPVKDWMPVPVSDSSEYLDRDAPIYLEEPEEPDAADETA
jgi:hypothetical protein